MDAETLTTESFKKGFKAFMEHDYFEEEKERERAGRRIGLTEQEVAVRVKQKKNGQRRTK